MSEADACSAEEAEGEERRSEQKFSTKILAIVPVGLYA